MMRKLFNPNLTPKEIIQLGSFGGIYFHPTERNIAIDVNEFPSDWFEGLPTEFYYSKKYNRKVNYFKIKCGQSQEEWEKMGWINPIDPRGWFQWYCRYYMGRRHIDDERQIKRWRAFTRHIGQIKKNCSKGDLACRRKQRQALLHWAYDSRKI